MIWIEVVLGFAVPIAWGAWQLWDLKKEKAKDALRADVKADAKADRS